jgi:hypothetical protein
VALASRAPRKLVGHAKPRLAPPVPVKHDLKGFRDVAASLGIELMPAQETAAKYITATNADGMNLYRDIAIVMARQNGKTTLMKPVIKRALLQGKRILHLAHTRELPRTMFADIAPTLPEDLFLRRRGKGGRMQTVWPRGGAGQEEILLGNGGSYRIAAAGQGGGRGQTTDLVIIDELREMKDNAILSAVLPTLAFSKDPQIIYLSNAGDETSVVLNAIRERAGDDPSLAYLEWSAAPERATDDVEGWAEANPSLGIYPQVFPNLERDYRSHRLQGTIAIFETENLCRWVITTRESLVDHQAWVNAQSDSELTPVRPFMAVSMDPEGRRASVAVSWQRPDGNPAVRLLFNVTGDPIDTNKLGMDIRAVAARLGVRQTGFDPLTDAELVKYLTKTKPVNGREFANASAQFVNVVTAGKLAWWDCDAVTDDLTWTARKPDTTDKGSFEAVRSKDDRPITASLAAIRAVWLASGPRPASPRVM